MSWDYNNLMLDINLIRNKPELIKVACKNKNLNPTLVGNLLEVDTKRRDLIAQIDSLRQEKNLLNDKLKKNRTKPLLSLASKLKEKLKNLEPQLRQVESSYYDLMLQIPNIPLEEVPVGKNESGNQTIKMQGKKPKFDFVPKDHVQLGLNLGLFDLDRGAKVAGFRGYYLTGDAVMLQMAIMQYALQKLIIKGFTPIIPPVVNKRSAFINTGHMPWGEKEAYKLETDDSDPENDYFLAGTAEVPLVSFYAGETFNEKDLPIKLAGFSPCYRREIGNYGKDTRGIYRIHEFMKIEQVILCKNDLKESIAWHEKILANSEEMLQELNLHYRVLLMCTGDMGEPQAKKYDQEVWMPGKNTYGEAGSNSIMTDFQSRRANIRYKAKDGTIKFVHMLNNTALASPRILAMIIENYQQKDGSVKIPDVLVPFFGKKLIKREN